MIYYKYYYLVYKLKSSAQLWIIEQSEYFTELKERIKNFASNIENYYIIMTSYNKKELTEINNTKFKRFKNFNINKNCEIIYQTE